MAIYSNLTVDQGSTFSVEIDVIDNVSDALDLAGYTVAGQIRKSYTSSTATDFTCSIPNAIAGTIKIGLSASTTNNMKAGRYLYDVEITKTANGEVTRVLEGQLEVRPGVTRES